MACVSCSVVWKLAPLRVLGDKDTEPDLDLVERKLFEYSLSEITGYVPVVPVIIG